MESPIVEDWRLGSSFWKAFGGEALALLWQDLRADPLSTPIVLGESTKDDIGRLGEDLAEHYLRRQEMMKILKRNFRAPQGGEVDVVCRHGDTLVFVEVKTRTSTHFGRPITAVDAEKEQLIARGALDWLHLLGKNDILFRFDVVEIILTEGEPPHIQRVENAFELPDNYYMPG